MAMVRLIYASRAFGYDDQTLLGILSVARRRNGRDGLTGALICRQDIYLQYLEGPEAQVDATLGRILKDDRHSDVRLLSRAPNETRMFPEWTMRHDPADSWMWSASEVAAGAVERATPDEALAVFAGLDRAGAPSEAARCPMGR